MLIGKPLEMQFAKSDKCSLQNMGNKPPLTPNIPYVHQIPSTRLHAPNTFFHRE